MSLPIGCTLFCLLAFPRFKPYSLNSDLLWSTSWILLQVSTWSLCTPLQEHGWWSTVPRVARKAFLHSGSSPRRSPGSISSRHPSWLKSVWLHSSSSSKLQHLVWKCFNISLAGQEGNTFSHQLYWMRTWLPSCLLLQQRSGLIISQ